MKIHSQAYQLVVALIGTLVVCVPACGQPEPYVVVTLSNVPASTTSLNILLTAGWLKAEETIKGAPGSISFVLPAGMLNRDSTKMNLEGAEIRVIVEALSGSQIIAFGSARSVFKKDLRHEMQLDLLPISSSTPPTLLSISINLAAKRESAAPSVASIIKPSQSRLLGCLGSDRITGLNW